MIAFGGMKRVDARGGVRKRKGRFAPVMRSAQRDVVERALRAKALKTERFVKAGAQFRKERERAAQIHDVALNGAALREAGDGLVDHGLEDGTRDVGNFGALVEQRLYVCFGEHAAAGGDGIGALCVSGALVHFLRRHMQQRGHLIDKRARAARAGAVHAYLHRALQEQDFRILAAQLDDDVRPGQVTIRCNFGEMCIRDRRYTYKVDLSNATEAGDIQREYGKDWEAAYNSYFMDVILGKKNVESDWDAYIEKLNSLEYGKYVEEMDKAPTLEEIFARYAEK